MATDSPRSIDAALEARRRFMTAPRPIGCFLGSASALVADALGRVGFDFAVIDLEHGPGDMMSAAHQLMALRGSPITPLVRTPGRDASVIARALDIGAAGVMAPQVRSPEEAAAIVRAATYGDAGGRGVATPVIRASGYGMDPDYEVAWNDARLVIAQIEDPFALEAAGEIAAVDGVDALFFGPADFAAAAGYPGAAETAAALERMCAAAKAVGKRAGCLPFAGLRPADLVARGCDFLIAGYDMALVRDAAAAALSEARALPS